MEKADLQLVLKRYFEEHQSEALDGVVKLATDVYNQVQKGQIKPYEPIEVEALGQTHDTYQAEIEKHSTGSISDADITRAQYREQNNDPDQLFGPKAIV